VYYGDETARSLEIAGAEGDATLRSFMNWEDIPTNTSTKTVLTHFQKIGQFRKNHPAIGAGIHKEISKAPFYTFSRTFTKGDYTDKVVIGLELPFGKKEINVAGVFEDGTDIHDAFSGLTATVKEGKVVIDSQMGIVLLERK
jgi:alpha-amylase